MPDLKAAAFVRDEASQVLALRDALAAQHGLAVAHAFAEVARCRGVDEIAADARVPADAIYGAFADPDRPDLALIGRVAAVLARNLGLADASAVQHDGSEDLVENHPTDARTPRQS